MRVRVPLRPPIFNKNMNILVIYHSADYDGKFSRDVCLYHLQNAGHSVDTFGWDYGNDVCPVDKYDQIYLVDISIDSLLNDVSLRSKIIWIDHHKTAIEKFDKNISGVRIDGVAACRLCWNWFTNNGWSTLQSYRNREVSEPYLITLAGEYDVWDKRKPEGEQLQLGLKAAKWLSKDSLEYFSNSQNAIHEKLLVSGKTIQQYMLQHNAEIAARAYLISFEGLRFLTLPMASGNSLLFDSRKNEKHDACLVWRYDGKKYTISLYHKVGREDLDLSTIAKKYNGGGHKGACGFTVDELPKEILTAVSPVDFSTVLVAPLN